MEQTAILTEIESLELFLKQQSDRFFKLENEFEGENKNSFLSDLHKELATVVKAVKDKVEAKGIESFPQPNESKQPEEKKPEEKKSMETNNENSPEEKKEIEETSTENKSSLIIIPPGKHFHELTERERIQKFIQDRIDALEGTGPEWNVVREWLEAQRAIEGLGGELKTANPDNIKGKNLSAAKKQPAAKKAAKKKAAKKAAKKK